VPVAATLNLAVCPTEMVWLAGCDVIEGAVDVAVPIPLKLILMMEPLFCLSVRTPEYARADDGSNFTENIKLPPLPAIWIGRVGPEYENPPPGVDNTDALMISTLPQLKFFRVNV
jgi:hypothetical protein